MSLPKPSLSQLPDIEDEDEESNTPKTTATISSTEAVLKLTDSQTMVASASNLSSWSSTTSVATRTNTDNPASMSHYVTNFNITKLAKQQQKKPESSKSEADQHDRDNQKKTSEDVPLKVFKQTPV